MNGSHAPPETGRWSSTNTPADAETVRVQPASSMKVTPDTVRSIPPHRARREHVACRDPPTSTCVPTVSGTAIDCPMPASARAAVPIRRVFQDRRRVFDWDMRGSV